MYKSTNPGLTKQHYVYRTVPANIKYAFTDVVMRITEEQRGRGRIKPAR